MQKVMMHCSISENKPLTVLQSENKFNISFAGIKMSLWHLIGGRRPKTHVTDGNVRPVEATPFQPHTM